MVSTTALRLQQAPQWSRAGPFRMVHTKHKPTLMLCSSFPHVEELQQPLTAVAAGQGLVKTQPSLSLVVSRSGAAHYFSQLDCAAPDHRPISFSLQTPFLPAGLPSSLLELHSVNVEPSFCSAAPMRCAPSARVSGRTASCACGELAHRVDSRFYRGRRNSSAYKLPPRRITARRSRTVRRRVKIGATAFRYTPWAASELLSCPGEGQGTA